MCMSCIVFELLKIIYRLIVDIGCKVDEKK